VNIKRLHIEFVEVEIPPLDYRLDYSNGYVTQEEFLIQEYMDLPPHYTASLNSVTRAKDTCRCWLCGTAVGYVLFEGDGAGGGELRWVPVFLVREQGGPVAVLCEGCFPTVPQQPYVP
jgi:hypothetical protein